MVLEEEEEKESEEVIEHEKEVLVVEEASSARVEKRSVLRKGSEGEEVRQMQVPFCSLSLSPCTSTCLSVNHQNRFWDCKVNLVYEIINILNQSF